MYSLIIPVYKNEGSLPTLLTVIADLNRQLDGKLEAVFVVDGSPDRSCAILREGLRSAEFSSQLLLLSRNFGSFAAIREGLRSSSGKYFAVMAADLQEPPALVLDFFRTLEQQEVDLVLGTRAERADPLASRAGSAMFWSLYRRLVQPQMPAGGVDIFGCNTAVRDELIRLESVRTSLVGQLIWLGFRSKQIPYVRVARVHGRSAWTLRKKIDYLMDSVFAFTDMPIKALLGIGTLGLLISTVFGVLVLAARISGSLAVPGYAATVLTILFFAALNMLGLGIVGSYAFRAYENSKGRPAAIVMTQEKFPSES